MAPGRGGQAQAMTVFPATYSMPTNVTKTAAKGALVSRHMLKVEPGEHMKTGQVGYLLRVILVLSLQVQLTELFQLGVEMIALKLRQLRVTVSRCVRVRR